MGPSFFKLSTARLFLLLSSICSQINNSQSSSKKTNEDSSSFDWYMRQYDTRCTADSTRMHTRVGRRTWQHMKYVIFFGSNDLRVHRRLVNRYSILKMYLYCTGVLRPYLKPYKVMFAINSLLIIDICALLDLCFY